jgi:cytochrome P450
VDSYAEGTARAARATIDRWMDFADGPARAIDWELDRAMIDVVERTLYTDGLQRDPNDVTDKIRLHYALVARPSVLDIFDMPRSLPRLTRLRHRPVHEFFAAMAQAMLDTRKSRMAGGACAPPNDLMTLLVQDGTELSLPDVLANIFTLFAATEPVASTLLWALYLLSRAPEWRKCLEAEVDRELPDDHYVEGSLPRLVATRAVIEETMRLYPAIATIHREAVAADELAGHAIAADTIIVIAPWVVHRHRLLWDRPDVFDPERFMPDTRAAVGRFAYLPFGMGPRTCIGGVFGLQTAIILLATILRRFRLDVAPGFEVRPVLRVALRPRGGLPMTIHRRR